MVRSSGLCRVARGFPRTGSEASVTRILSGASALEIIELVAVLKIPQPFLTSRRDSFDAIEALCLMLARFRSGGDIDELAALYDRCPAAISMIVNSTVEFIDIRWSWLLDFDTDGLLHPTRLREYAQAVYSAGAPLRTVWGFIDCTIRRICRPTDYQRQAYNGHKKFHAMKFQAVILPNGMFGHLAGPFPGRNNDCFLLNETSLIRKCEEHMVLVEHDPDGNETRTRFTLFGDPAYGVHPCLVSPFAGVGNRTDDEKRWNAAMANVRIEVEHGFAIVLAKWPYLNHYWKHRTYSSPVGCYYRVGVLLTNAHNCLYPNQIAQRFECQPPSLDDYFRSL